MPTQPNNIAMETAVNSVYRKFSNTNICKSHSIDNCICILGSFTDFGEFVARDNYFNSSTNNTINNSANNFPIGTFSIEQATQPAVSQTFPQTDYFNPATASQLMSMFNDFSVK